MATRNYTKNGREFVITVSGIPHPTAGYNSWTVEVVTEHAGVGNC